jgi:predicted Zn-dependent protease
MRAVWIRICACAGLLLSSGCQTVQTTAPGVLDVDREQRFPMSAEQMRSAASQAYAQQLSAARSRGILNEDSHLTARVRRIAQRLVRQTGAFRDDAAAWDWQVNTLETDELNAYAMPGGKIMVYEGIVERLNLSDAELAAIVGHEIAHALREHSRERVSRQYGQQLLLTGAAVIAGIDPNVIDLADAIANVTFQLPHSRQQEAEADMLGLELMARAGYDPHAAVSLWKKMVAADETDTPELLSTHPAPQTRIEGLQALVPRVLPLYRTAANG